MTPFPGFGVIPTGEFPSALRTGPLNPGSMLKPNIYAALCYMQLYSFYKPWFFQSQNTLVKVGVPHVKPLLGDSLYTNDPPTENPEEPNFIRLAIW